MWWEHLGRVDSGLSRRVPWYSVGYGDLVNRAANVMWGRGDSTQGYQVARRVGLRYYELSDHLGNVTATVLDRKTGVLASGSATLYDWWKADVASLTDYYPFGMQLPGRVYEAGIGLGGRFGFNGQQKDNEIYGDGKATDFGARMFDPQIARFFSRDPDGNKYPHWSPFSYATNSPVRIVDDGFGPTYELLQITYGMRNGKPVMNIKLSIELQVALINVSSYPLSSADGGQMASAIQGDLKYGTVIGKIGVDKNAKSYVGQLIQNWPLNQQSNRFLKANLSEIEINYEYSIRQSVRYAGSADNVRSGEDILALTDGGKWLTADGGIANQFNGTASIPIFEAAVGSFSSIGIEGKLHGGAHELGHDIGMLDTYTKSIHPQNLMGDMRYTNLTSELLDQIFTSAFNDILVSRRKDGANQSGYMNPAGSNVLLGKYLPTYQGQTPQQRLKLHFSH